jgi:anaerobic C4-dicarboxylate transporter
MLDVEVSNLFALINWAAAPTTGALFWMVLVSLLLRSLRKSDPTEFEWQFLKKLVTWLQALNSPQLFIVALLLSFSVPVLAIVVVNVVPAEWIEVAQPYYEYGIALVAVFGVAWMGQQFLYFAVFKVAPPAIPGDLIGIVDLLVEAKAVDDEAAVLKLPEDGTAAAG